MQKVATSSLVQSAPTIYDRSPTFPISVLAGAAITLVSATEKAISDLTKSAKTWVQKTKLVQNVKAWSDENKVARAMELLNKGASFEELYKKKLKPDHVYKPMRLKTWMRREHITGRWSS
ncbi:uncharacterized protein IUM83_09466 [Phytophthora cinnamomi]|uniref:uncharacterized protein n=1 Tax=Phytophthora cinnamomi TaxID=4785 RepID=UPI002A2A50FC|nr:hypothetical protein IUM83_09466 [Phytophthora cinnamomi]KAJ8524491.1 hypothetical protein ON010_g16627 [Phytophthora cinnamomi]